MNIEKQMYHQIKLIGNMDAQNIDPNSNLVLSLMAIIKSHPERFMEVVRIITPHDFGRTFTLLFGYLTRDERDTDKYNPIICAFIQKHIEPHFDDFHPDIVKLCKWHLERGSWSHPREI